MHEVECLIFSKDRASQLDLLLRSARLNLGDYFKFTVLFTHSTDDFEDGYTKLFRNLHDHPNDYPTPIVFWYENTFQKDVQQWANEVNRKYLCMLTDDCIIYRDIKSELKDSIFKLLLHNSLYLYDCCTFSIRLGLNTNIQSYDKQDILPDLRYHDCGDYIIWNRMNYLDGSNYNYPMSVDGHIWKAETVRDILDRISYDGPNQLERYMSLEAHSLSQYVASFKNSLVFANPVNQVSGINRAGVIHPISPERLNERYIQDEIIKLEDVVNSESVNCTHMEIPLKFVKRTVF